MRNLIDSVDLTREEADGLIALAQDIIAAPAKYAEVCKGLKLATLFYEPSTRTRLSFEAAMIELGGSVIGFSDAATSSASKGETVADTVRVIDKFADVIAMRHFKEGAPLVASRYSSVPIINAGDGSHLHPTQTLTDLLTIQQEMGRIDGLTVGFCGDLKFGRTVHSLVKALKIYRDVKFILISPEELKLPQYVKDEVAGESSGNSIAECSSLDEALPQLDVLYMTRVQQERFASQEEYERLKSCYILDGKKMQQAKREMVILHPLPRVTEIAQEVDEDPRAAYFRQVGYGKFIRMALICRLLEWKKEGVEEWRNRASASSNAQSCSNVNCISATELVEPLEQQSEGEVRCVYCDKPLR